MMWKTRCAHKSKAHLLSTAISLLTVNGKSLTITTYVFSRQYTPEIKVHT